MHTLRTCAIYGRTKLLHCCMLLLLLSLLAACGGFPGEGAAVGQTPEQGGDNPGSSPDYVTQQVGPLTSILMIDATQGWALTKDAILKTTDGGIHWINVSPAGTKAGDYSIAKGTFKSVLQGWVASVREDQVRVERTDDGGKSWKGVTLAASAPKTVDAPAFLDNQTGWLTVMGAPEKGNQPVELFATTDGGMHWKKIARSGEKNSLPKEGLKTGITFKDEMTGFLTLSASSGSSKDPGLLVTRDGGATWKKMPSPSLPSDLKKVSSLGMMPPVFFGELGFLPVRVATDDGKYHTLFYRTSDGGGQWIATSPLQITAGAVFVLDPYHLWVVDSQTNQWYSTVDGGANWNQGPTAPATIREISFIDARHGWSLTDTELLHTEDGGVTWKPLQYTMMR